MKSRLFTALGIASIAALSGCASGPQMHRNDPSRSEAWNVTRAADYKKLKDADRKDVTQKIGEAGTGIGSAAVGGGLGFLSNVNGLSLPTNVGLNVLGGLLLGADTPKARGTNIVAWIPKSEVSGNEEALQQVAGRVYSLVEKNLRNMDMPEPYHWGEIKQRELNSAGYKNIMRSSLEGGKCDTEDFNCAVSSTSWPEGNAWRQDATAPESLGGYPAWRIEISLSYSFYDKSKWSQTQLARVPLLRALNRVSAALPENYFVYVAPQSIPFKQSQGEYRFLPAPVVLREGKALYFVEPKQKS